VLPWRAAARFTFYTDQNLALLTVISGARVRGLLRRPALPDGGGPCEHSASSELSGQPAPAKCCKLPGAMPVPLMAVIHAVTGCRWSRRVTTRAAGQGAAAQAKISLDGHSPIDFGSGWSACQNPPAPVVPNAIDRDPSLNRRVKLLWSLAGRMLTSRLRLLWNQLVDDKHTTGNITTKWSRLSTAGVPGPLPETGPGVLPSYQWGVHSPGHFGLSAAPWLKTANLTWISESYLAPLSTGQARVVQPPWLMGTGRTAFLYVPSFLPPTK